MGGLALFWKGQERSSRPFLTAFLWYGLIQAQQIRWLLSFEYQGIFILIVFFFLTVTFASVFALVNRAPLGFALWTLFEWAFEHFLCGFNLGGLGLFLTSNLHSAQLVSVIGVLGLTFWVFWTNRLLYRGSSFALFALVATFPYLFGMARVSWHRTQLEASLPLHAGLVQTAIRPEEKGGWGRDIMRLITPYEQWQSILEDLGKEKSYDLIALPEVALPYGLHQKIYPFSTVRRVFEETLGLSPPLSTNFQEQGVVSNAFWAQAISDAFDAEVVIGLIDGDHNGAHHFSPKRGEVDSYAKRVLLPIAEAPPLPMLRGVARSYGFTEFLEAGAEAKVFKSNLKIAPTICYEELFGHLVREGRQKGGSLFVNLTNDVWYPNTSLPRRHFEHGRLRAIENGIPLLRACNTGVTAGVDALGQVRGAIFDEWTRGVLSVSVPGYTAKTLYSFWGDYFILSIAMLLLLISALPKIYPRDKLSHFMGS